MAKKKAREDQLEFISKKDFDNLVRRCGDFQTKARGLSGKLGNEIKDAVEFRNLDRVAFSMFRRLNAMPHVKLATSLAHFDKYREMGDLDWRAAEQGELAVPRQELEPKPKKARAKKAKPEAQILQLVPETPH